MTGIVRRLLASDAAFALAIILPTFAAIAVYVVILEKVIGGPP